MLVFRSDAIATPSTRKQRTGKSVWCFCATAAVVVIRNFLQNNDDDDATRGACDRDFRRELPYAHTITHITDQRAQSRRTIVAVVVQHIHTHTHTQQVHYTHTTRSAHARSDRERMWVKSRSCLCVRRALRTRANAFAHASCVCVCTAPSVAYASWRTIANTIRLCYVQRSARRAALYTDYE